MSDLVFTRYVRTRIDRGVILDVDGDPPPFGTIERPARLTITYQTVVGSGRWEWHKTAVTDDSEVTRHRTIRKRSDHPEWMERLVVHHMPTGVAE